MTYRRKLLLTLLLLPVIPLLAGGFFALPFARDAVIARASSQLNTVADLKTIQINRWLRSGRDAVRLVAGLRETEEAIPALMSPESDQPQQDTARSDLGYEMGVISEIFPVVRSVSLLHPETGRVMASTEPALEGRDRIEEDYFIHGRDALFVGSVQYSLGREEPVIVVSGPHQYSDGRPAAVISAELNLSDLAETLSSRSGLGRSGRAYLLDSRGFYVTLPPHVDRTPLGAVARSEGVQRALSGENGIDVYDDPNGVPVLGVYRWLGEESLALLVEVDEAEVTGHIRYAWAFIGLSVLVLVAITAIVAHRLSGWLRRPLIELRQAAQALQAGDLTRRVPGAVGDDLGRLAVAFNEMAEELERSDATLRNLLDQSTAGQQQAEARLASVVDTASDAIISTDANLRIIMFNQAAERMLKFPAKDAIGENIQQFIPDAAGLPIPGDADAPLEEEAYRIMRGGLARETLVRRDNGEEFPAEVSVSAADTAGGRINTIILRDITERKFIESEIEALTADLERRVEARTRELRETQAELMKRERLATLGQLTATVSHEIRNPLAAMRTSLYVIEKRLLALDDSLKKPIDRITRSITRCDRIIDELLDFSRSRDLETEDIQVDTWLASVVEEQTIPDKVTVRVEPGLPNFFSAVDRERLRRAVINVLENAVHAIEESGAAGVVTLRTGLVDEGYEIQISDSGPGIPLDKREQIFEPLFSTRNFGVGLGLAVARNIVEQHGGLVRIEDAPEGGACFVFRLPAHADAPVAA